MSEQPNINSDGTITIKTSSWNRVVRERDEAREKYDTLAVENMLEVHRLCKECDEAREELENYKAESVHTCHSECKRPNCVLRRERAQAQVALVQALRERDEAIADRDIARLEVEEISHDLSDAKTRIWQLEKQIEGLNNFANERYDEIQKVRKERDIAREDASNYYAKIGELIDNCKDAQYESEQQARLLGISAERECALRSKIFELERKILQLEQIK